MSGFSKAQVAQLLKPIAPQRVLKDAGNHSHVSQQDVTAHLIRVFGFGNFDTEILDVQCVFERPTTKVKSGETKPDPTRFDVCYRALLRLTVRDEHGHKVCSYEDGSTALAQNQTLGDAHDLAYKSALSLSKKRAAINLGDQFGLSLYNKGQMSALVIGTLVHPDEHNEAGDVEKDVPQQLVMGNDEIDPSEAA
jgi:recombination DNA repair RAD52 pathway protein